MEKGTLDMSAEGWREQDSIRFIKHVAIVIYRGFTKINDGIEFITNKKSYQQVGIMRHPKNHVIPRHYHNPQTSRIALYTQEVLLIREGKIAVMLYDENKNFLETAILQSGDIICLLSGSHEISFLEGSEVLEIKQGPYTEDKDKTRW